MKDFDYIIIGGGCSGLSLAYELEIIFDAIITWVCFLEAHAKVWVIFAWVDEYFFDERLKFFISSCILILLRAI